VVQTTRSGPGGTLEVVTHGEYDDAGRKTAEVDPLGNRTEYAYDAQGQVLCEASPEGTIYYQYDPLGRKTRTFTGSPSQVDNDWQYTYETLGRLSEVIVVARNGQPGDIDSTLQEQYRTPGVQPETTCYHYDLLGNLDWERHSNTLVTDYEYDGLNRLEQVRHFIGNSETLPLRNVFMSGIDAEYDYDLLADGRRSGVTEKEGGLVAARTDWFYDSLGRLVREVYDSQTDNTLDFATDYLFDLSGNRLWKTTDHSPTSNQWTGYRAGAPLAVDEAIRYLYDSNDRLLEEDLDTGADGSIDQRTRYEYGPNANPASGEGGDWTVQTKKSVFNAVGNSVSTSTFTYDLQGRMETAVIESYQSDGTTVARRDAARPREHHAVYRALE